MHPFSYPYWKEQKDILFFLCQYSYRRAKLMTPPAWVLCMGQTSRGRKETSRGRGRLSMNVIARCSCQRRISAGCHWEMIAHQQASWGWLACWKRSNCFVGTDYQAPWLLADRALIGSWVVIHCKCLIHKLLWAVQCRRVESLIPDLLGCHTQPSGYMQLWWKGLARIWTCGEWCNTCFCLTLKWIH